MKELLEALSSAVVFLGKPLIALFLCYLIIKALMPFFRSLLVRLANGQHKNGAPKNDLAGQATIDFWRIEFREIVSRLLVEQENDEKARYEALILVLSEMKLENRDSLERLRSRLHEISSTITTALLEMARR